jgi:NADPH-dependent ferric siderophore reductase
MKAPQDARSPARGGILPGVLTLSCQLPRLIVFTMQSSLTAIRLFFRLLARYNRCRELRRLIGWAKQKRLRHPQRLYTLRLQDEDVRLSRDVMQYRTLASVAFWVHRFNTLCFAAPRYPRRGLAAGYRRGQFSSAVRCASV